MNRGAVTVLVVHWTVVAPVEVRAAVVGAAHGAVAQAHGASCRVLSRQIQMLRVRAQIEHGHGLVSPVPPRLCIAETLAASSLANLRA